MSNESITFTRVLFYGIICNTSYSKFNAEIGLIASNEDTLNELKSSHQRTYKFAAV